MSRRRIVAWCAAAAGMSVARQARALSAPTGTVVLTVSGKVHSPNGSQGADFDLAMLAGLPQTSVSTRTPWYASARQFTGPLLRDVLSAAGAHGKSLRVRALNDYRVDIPLDDAQRHDLIVAHRIDGQPMAVRDKGPLFLIYPFDASPELRTAMYYSRSVWQLRAIEVF